MNTSFNHHRAVRGRVKLGEYGMSMIELLIAMVVLAVGLLGCAGMILGGIKSDSRNKNDTTAVVLDQEILEEFATYKNYPTSGYVVINDCGSTVGNANQHQASVVEGASGTGAGATLYTSATAPLPSQVGDINWGLAAPAYATSTTPGYAMTYQACNGDTFEVRWNVMQVAPNANGVGRLSLLTVSSRQTASKSSNSGMLFAIPATLRTLIED